MSDEKKLDLDAIDARAKAATPGPWESVAGGRYVAATQSTSASSMEAICADSGPDDARFIAHAREDVPALCARVREMEAEQGNEDHLLVVVMGEREQLAHRVRELEEQHALDRRDELDAIARAEQAERERDVAVAQLDYQRGCIAAVVEVEAQAAAMRRALLHVTEGRHRRCARMDDCGMLVDALAPDAGRALLAELAALREVAEAAREVTKFTNWKLSGESWQALGRALAKLDATKGGSK
jgi:hypothetical protein